LKQGKWNYCSIVCILLLTILALNTFTIILPAHSAPSWPSSWIQVDWDKNENGAGDDWRDVQYAYYQFDSSYLYLKLKCYAVPGSEWGAKKEGRYKWWIDLEGNLYYSGDNIFEAEYLVFVEDTDSNGVGEMYKVQDTNNDGNFGEYEPWPPGNSANYKITDSNIGGWRIVATNQIEMYISWASIGNPSSYWLAWATDQQNPNLDQGPTTDHQDEEEPIAVHNVAAISQTPNPTTVTQGDHVTISVVVQNQGTQTESFDVTCYFDTGVVGTQHVTNLAAGHSTTLSFDWDTTGVPPNTYVIKAWADSGAAIAEIDETDNWCTAPASVTVEPVKVHDVAAIDQVPDATSVQQGTTVNIDVTVKNLGDFTETFQVACYYDGTPVASSQTVTNLIAGATAHVYFAWDTATVSPGTYQISAMADSAHAITEVDEDNNECTSLTTVTVYIVGEPGELFVDKAMTSVVSGPDPPEVGSTTVYELTILVSNPGGSDVAGVTVEDFISSHVTYVSVGVPTQGTVIATATKITWNVGTLHPGDVATLTFRVSLTPTSPGLKYLDHKSDLSASGYTGTPPSLITDFGDTDVTVTAIKRDVAAISQDPSSTVVNQGDTISIDVVVKNLGDYYDESFDVTCYRDGVAIGTLRAYSLAPGDTETLIFSWDTTGVSPGTYVIRAVADIHYEITESDETNNECTASASVKIVIHDIATLSQTPTPTTVTQGDTVTIQVVVKNQGTEPESFTVTCHYDSSDIPPAQTVTDLAAGAQTTLTFIWNTAGVPPATYYISAVASTVPGEKDTSNNACTSTTTVIVLAPPAPGALWVDKTQTAVISGPDPPIVGKTTVYEITITVKNTGGKDVTSVKVEDTISSDVSFVGVGTPSQGSAAYISPKIVWNVGTLAPSATATLTFRVSLTPTTAGLKYLNHKEDLSASGFTNGTPISDKGDTDVTVTACKPAPAVGGEWVAVSRSELMAPWAGIASLMIATATLFVCSKRLRKRYS
jgi:uncharacterized repeat protein (TIGR01451 family)